MSNMLTIYDELGSKLCEVLPDDGSYRYREIKGDDEVTLTFPSSVPLHLPLGSYLLYDGIRYTLEEPPCIKKQGTRRLEYTCIFSAPVSMLKRYIFRNTDDGRLKFTLTAKPDEHLAMLVKNMNLRVGGWSAGACVDEVEKLVTYDCTTCWDALELMADAFGTEWEVNDKEISLKKVAYFEDNPLVLSYGLGNGLLPGVSRDNRDGESCGLEIVYAIGGERNVVPSRNTGGEKRGNPLIQGIAPIVVNPDFTAPVRAASAPPVQAVAASTPVHAVSSLNVTTTDSTGVAIGNKTLILPRGQELEYEGEVYCTDAQGYYVYKKNKPLTSRKEGVLDCSEIYPSRVGTISEVIVVDGEKNLYDFVDSSIPDDLDFSACQMDGEKITVIFQDGMLAGKEFDVDKYIHSERRFALVPQEIDGVMMPDDVFRPVVGGKYAVFGISLPDAYVCDNASKTGASWDMFRKAAAYLHEHSDYLFTFGGKLDGIWAKRNWEAIKDRLVLGGTVLFQDNQLQADGVRIRITGIRQSLNDPHSPELTLSNETIGQRLLGRIEQAESQAVLIDASASSQRQFTKRTFRDAKETMQALQDALDSFKGEFTEGISPITINSMQLLVGSERCQFEFVASKTSTTVVKHDVTYNETTKQLTCAAGFVRYSYGNTMSANEQDAMQTAQVSAFTSGELEADSHYYVYIRIAKTSLGAGTFMTSKDALDYDKGGCIYLLLGILDKEQFENRTWTPMYSYTEITPGRIRVNKIISTDGKTYFDLANNEIGGRINFKDGLVSGEIGVTNRIGVGGSGDDVKAGMNGRSGTNPVRFWAGATALKMYSAPFMVYDNGNVVMNSALIGGDSVFGGMIKPNYIIIDKYNISDYSYVSGNIRYLDFSKFAGPKSTLDIIYDGSLSGFFPSLYYGNTPVPNTLSIDDLEKYIGCIIRIINRGGGIGLTGGAILQDDGGHMSFESPIIGKNKEAIFECFVGTRTKNDYNETVNEKVIGWRRLYYGGIISG